MNVKTFLPILLVVALTLTAQAQVPAEQLMLLIAGPSGDRIDPAEQSVVFELNQFRGEHSFHALKMGSMHFDRPREAALLTQRLNYNPQAGVTVGLVELSSTGVPVRSLVKFENVNPQDLPSIRDTLVTQWAQESGVSLPQGLAHLNPGQPSPPPTSTAQISPQPPPNRQRTVYSPGGIRTIAIRLADTTNGVWDQFKGTAFRPDHNDVPLRKLTLDLAQKANYFRQAADRGVVYPKQQLQEVLAAGRAWKMAEPELYLPSNLKPEVRRILDLLIEVEDIEYQSRDF